MWERTGREERQRNISDKEKGTKECLHEVILDAQSRDRPQAEEGSSAI